MDFSIKINCDNAAFDHKEKEVKRILENIIKQLEDGIDANMIQDVNGNNVGDFYFIGGETE